MVFGMNRTLMAVVGRGPYEKGRRHGTWTITFEDGSQEEVTFKDGAVQEREGSLICLCVESTFRSTDQVDCIVIALSQNASV